MEIQDIKQRLSILTVLAHYNLKPDRNNHIKCPFHEDDKPSCRIYPETNTFHCFGCNAKGDTIEFIQKKDGISKHEAILKAQDFIGLPTEPKPQPKPEPKPELPQEQKTAILTEAFKHFARSLNAKPEKAIQYLSSRKLDYKKLSIGYDIFNYGVEIPSGVPMIYIFDAGVLESTPWSTVVNDYMVLKRFDLSLQNLQKMDWTITYP